MGIADSGPLISLHRNESIVFLLQLFGFLVIPKVRHFLKNLASIIGQADGEIVCEIANEEGCPDL